MKVDPAHIKFMRFNDVNAEQYDDLVISIIQGPHTGETFRVAKVAIARYKLTLKIEVNGTMHSLAYTRFGDKYVSSILGWFRLGLLGSSHKLINEPIKFNDCFGTQIKVGDIVVYGKPAIYFGRVDNVLPLKLQVSRLWPSTPHRTDVVDVFTANSIQRLVVIDDDLTNNIAIARMTGI